MESVRIRSFSGAYFPPTGLNTKRYSVTPRIEFGKMSECGKKRPDKLRIRTLFTQQQLIPQTSTCHNLLYWAAFNYVKFILLILAPKILVAILINSLSYLFMISLFKNYIVNIIFYFVDVYSDSILSVFCHISLAFESY